MLETLDYTIRIGSTPTLLYFDLYLYSAYAAHYVYLTIRKLVDRSRKQPEGSSFNGYYLYFAAGAGATPIPDQF